MATTEQELATLKLQQADTVQACAKFIANWRDNPDAAEQEMKTWISAVDPTLDYSKLAVPKAPPR